MKHRKIETFYIVCLLGCVPLVRYDYVNMDMDWTPFVVHNAVHMVQKEAGVKRVLDKARTVVKFFHKSSCCKTEDIGPVLFIVSMTGQAHSIWLHNSLK